MVVFLLVLVVVLALLGAVHWYVWRRLVRDVTVAGSRARRFGTAAVVVLPLLSLAALVSARAGAPFPVQQAVAWPGFLWLAVLLYLVLALVAGEAVRPLLRVRTSRRAAAAPAEPVPAAVSVSANEPAGNAEPPAEPATASATEPESATEPASATEPEPVTAPAAAPAGDVSRRLFVSRVVAGSAAAVAVGTVGYGTYGVLRGPRVKRVTVPLAKIPRAAHGYRIAVVSDIHLGPILGRAHTQRIVDSINATQPDLIAVVGDLVDGTVENLGPAAEPLARLRARHGSFFVTGNHEYFSGADAWVDHVRELGLRPLRNARVEIPAGFDLAGVDDVAGESEGQGPDFARALGDRDRARAAVLLAHQPIVVHDAVRHGVDLQLSGHTHGGQLWPGNYLAELANPTVAGLERYGDTQLYVSRGAGAWGPPVRVGAPSDITIVELASKQA
ncbi:metallophosphoesterase [Streptomyces tanashiensis]|uniref:Metallophosphoesterase n=1 Tax=Streptomyces tanashiensis TaxID=67367 RepID=A0ABY6QWP2_9ACTN|nr:metallophosphoesterase [Streptomyces tanashiensis]UZX22130.1 metallophosphoesterase [Streptomyces tanashiensis]